MKKLALILATLILFAGIACADTQYTFVFNADDAGNGETLDLSEYGLTFFLPEYFLEKVVTNNENAICYYERQIPKHAVEFLRCGYSTLEEAKGEFKDVTPVQIVVNGMEGIAFPYLSSLNDGQQIYVNDAFLDVPGYGIINFYEEADSQQDLAQYLRNVLPFSKVATAEETVVETVVETVKEETAVAATEETVADTESDAAANAGTAQVNTTAAEEGAKVRTHSDGAVKMRKTPDAADERVGVAEPNTVYPLLSIAENGWYEIQLRDGTVGFISPNFAKIVK